MLSKNIKTIVTIAFTTAFLSACSTTSKPAGNVNANAGGNSVTSDTSSNQSSTAKSHGSVKNSVNTGVLKPAATVFYFDFDSSVLRNDSRQLLNRHASALKAKPRQVRLEGHADERGTREYNMALGERRAQAVRAYLVAQGVDSSLMEVISYGEEYPAIDARTQYAWQQNRRVEIK